ncbi:MAG: gliding motility-associated C-terminal domain-containing protein, partial [Bacteroidia bacterium]|nr:gliding motility-associated C-terminal domain-containing protein [Bacteroidia bacterium]
MNADGVNDAFTIDNIEQFPKNRVLIFNRWGEKLADIQGYDNVSKFWPERGQATKYPSSTYFYIVELGDGSKPIKGWVELMKNQ